MARRIALAFFGVRPCAVSLATRGLAVVALRSSAGNAPIITSIPLDKLTTGLASHYLGDLGIEKDPAVVFETSNRDRLKENLGALQHPLTPEQLAELDKLFPPPAGRSSLEML